MKKLTFFSLFGVLILFKAMTFPYLVQQLRQWRSLVAAINGIIIFNGIILQWLSILVARNFISLSLKGKGGRINISLCNLNLQFEDGKISRSSKLNSFQLFMEECRRICSRFYSYIKTSKLLLLKFRDLSVKVQRHQASALNESAYCRWPSTNIKLIRIRR